MIVLSLRRKGKQIGFRLENPRISSYTRTTGAAIMADDINVHHAIQDFQEARQRAAIQEILARITGKSNRLLSYDDVAEKLKLRARTERGVRIIPLDAIVGSVGRYTEFTRTFLPRSDANRQRWAGVKTAMQSGAGLPPIEVYKVGEAYFVVDGNHRVSIARQEGFESIEARVIEFKTDFNLTPDTDPDELIIEAEYMDFLQQTRIRESRPNVDLKVTTCCQYEKLLDQIRICRHLLREEQERDVPLQDSAAYWYDTIYIPLAETIRDRGLLRWFPNRTITDLYIWIAENRAALEKELGWEIQSEAAAADLILKNSARSKPGAWRESRTVTRYTDHLFADILVPLSGHAESWDALDQAVLLAQREGAALHGLHVVDSIDEVDSPDSLGVKARFDLTCRQAGVEGTLAIDVGDITLQICDRAIATDLIVLKITNPPSAGFSALESPFRTILQRSSRPLIAVPGAATRFERALLAFDGSDRAKEALFVAAYLAEMWKTSLVVLTAVEGTKVKAEAQDYARRYLELHEVQADYILSEEKVTESFMQNIEEHKIDLVLMGGYGGSVFEQVFIGSAVDFMLRESAVPLFICR
jgi:nucleotide-binding universal stress UspA family protein